MNRFRLTLYSAACVFGGLTASAQDGKPAAKAGLSVALQGPRRAVQLLFNDDSLGELIAQAGYSAKASGASGDNKTYGIPLKFDGFSFNVDATLAGPEDDQYILLTTAVGRPQSRSALDTALNRTKVAPGRFVLAETSGVLYLTLTVDVPSLFTSIDNVKAKADQLRKAIDQEADEGRKKELTRQLNAEELKLLLDIRLRLKPEVFRAKVETVIEIIRRNPEFLDAGVWSRSATQLTLGRGEPDAGLKQSREHYNSLKMDYPTREGSSYHHFYAHQWRPNYLAGNIRDYERTIGQTEKWRSAIPTNITERVEANPDETRLQEASSLHNLLWRKTYLAQTNYDYDRTIAVKSKYRGSIPVQSPDHYYHSLDTNLPVKHFVPERRVLLGQFYTGTAGPYRDARHYDAAQKRPIWVGY